MDRQPINRIIFPGCSCCLKENDYEMGCCVRGPEDLHVRMTNAETKNLDYFMGI